VARIARRGFLRVHVFPKFGYYPWECAMCRREFMIRKRGGAYRKASTSSPSTAASDRAPSPEGNPIH